MRGEVSEGLVVEERRIDDAWVHERDADAGALELVGEALAESRERELGGAIDSVIARADPPRDRGDVDHVPVAARQHLRENRAGEVERAVQVGLEDGRDLLGTGLEKGQVAPDTSVVDEKRNGPEALAHGRHRYRDGGGIAHVAGKRRALPGRERGDDLGQTVGAAGDESDRRAGGRQVARKRRADAARGAGDERRRPFDPHDRHDCHCRVRRGNLPPRPEIE